MEGSDTYGLSGGERNGSESEDVARDTGKEVVTTALVNSGFETETPQIILPIRAASELGLYSLLPFARVVELGTAAGPTRMYLLPKAVEIAVITEDRRSRSVISDALISPAEEEVLIND